MTFKCWCTFKFIFQIFCCVTGVTWDEINIHPAWKRLAKFECGESVADRIIGGVQATLGEFPWLSRLGYIEDGELDWRCGGALITDRHIVTAAHCVQSNHGFLLTSIRLGEHNTKTNPDCQLKICATPVQDRRVKKIITHKDFNKPAFHNDIAIIELNVPVQLNEYVAPICLPRGIDQLADLKLGERLTVAGWGTMNMTTEDRADVLQRVAIPVVNSKMCDNFGSGFNMTEAEICAGAEYNKDACGGDSGGPLMKVFDTREGPKNILVGVVSFGPTLCGNKKPGVYASVTFFLKWILDNIM